MLDGLKVTIIPPGQPIEIPWLTYVKQRKNRKVERAAVNAARSFFEANGCVFQEVDLANDYGKDAYVDLPNGEDGVGGACLALQIKGGRSFRTTKGYRIPLDQDHAEVWRTSTLPLLGIVFDPDDGQLRWCSITEQLSSLPKKLPRSLTVPAGSLLTVRSLSQEIPLLVEKFQRERALASAILDLTSQVEARQSEALLDCFGIGRNDARVFKLLRRLMTSFEGRNRELVIGLLSHATLHPDIYWSKNNEIAPAAKREVAESYSWSLDEVIWLVASVDADEWRRGGVGQCVYHLLVADPRIEHKMADAAMAALEQDKDEAAFWIMFLAVYWSGEEGGEMYEGYKRMDRRFGHLPLSGEIQATLDELGYVSMF